MAVDIGPKIGIDGEAEFRKELNNINQQIRTLGSEMKAVTSAFDAGDDAEKNLAEQTRVLNAQIDAQEKKLGQLQKGLAKSAEYYGEADTKTLKWKQAVNEATAELNRLKRQADKTEDSVEDLGDSMDDSVGSLDDFKKALVAGFSVTAIVAGVRKIASAIMDLEESTREYRQIMNGLEASGKQAGYETEQTAYVFQKFQGVMGDLDGAKEATAQLQTLTLTEGQLRAATDGVIGSWNLLGGAAPIETLSESISQTILAGKSTGAFSDVLLAAGESEEEFNKKLEAATDTAERTQLVLNTLANKGLVELGKSYQETNADIIAANNSQLKLDEAWAGLGQTLAPAANFMRETLAGTIVWVTEKVEDAIDAIKRLTEWYKRMSSQVDSVDEWSGAPTWGYDGSHAAGLNYVPWDGYLAQLHKGEMVLTRQQAELLRSGQNGLTRNDLQSVTSAAVNALSAGQSLAGTGPIEINLVVNGKKFYQETLEDLRFVQKSNPEARNDA